MRRADIQNVYMFDTKVENIVINEHLIFASAEAIKVYLVGLMYADMNKNINNLEIAKTVGITEEDVKKAWQYWEKSGIVTIEDEEVVFKNIKEELVSPKTANKKVSNKDLDVKKEKMHPLISKDFSEMFSAIEKIGNRPLTYHNADRIRDLAQELNVDTKLIIFAHEHGQRKGVSNIYDFSYNVIMKWLEKGVKSVEDAKEYLKNADAHFHVYKKVMGYLGFKRLATQAEMEIMDSWIEKGISVDEMLQACKKTSGISSPNLNYVNKVLMNSLKEKTGIDEKGKVSREKLREYMQYLRNKAEEERDILVGNIERKFPRIAELGSDIRDLNFKLIQETIKGGGKIQFYKAKVTEKQNEIDRLLHQNNIPKDYMDIKYKCPICKDFGTKEDGSICSCMSMREEEAKTWTKA